MPVYNAFRELGLTAYQLAKRTGISETTARTLINNPRNIPRQEVLDKVCDALKIQPPIYWQEEERES